jgi:hypothetical protein
MSELIRTPDDVRDEGGVAAALDRRVARRETRRAFFTAALGAAAAGGAFAFATAADAQTVTDADILNFALQLEYLEANFYAFATTGAAIAATYTSGATTAGAATGGRKVTFTDPQVSKYALEIAADELAHVNLLRAALGGAVSSQPAIDLSVSATSAFSKAAQRAGLVGSGGTFDPYASDENFLLGAYLFEDVGVTAYKGAAPLITNLVYLDAAAAILGTEAYHAALIRSTLFRKGLVAQSEAISTARDGLDGGTDTDQGVAPITRNGLQETNIVPTDGDGIVPSRSPAQTLNIVYLSSAAVTAGGFFPSGVNGTIKSSAAN